MSFKVGVGKVIRGVSKAFRAPSQSLGSSMLGFVTGVQVLGSVSHGGRLQGIALGGWNILPQSFPHQAELGTQALFPGVSPVSVSQQLRPMASQGSIHPCLHSLGFTLCQA